MAAAHTHDTHTHEEDVAYHASVKGYVTGFLLSVVLTAIPFWLVMQGVLAPATAGMVVLVFAAVQMVVHMVYFLHLDGKAEGGWSILALLFTAVLVFILMAGSIWVMYHMNTNMMPSMDGHATHGEP